jgi:hypothetical protein
MEYGEYVTAVIREAKHYLILYGPDMPSYCKYFSFPQVKSKGGALTLSNPIFLPPAYSPALIYFGLERGWWTTCPYYMKSIGLAPTAERENKRNKKGVRHLPTLERNRKIVMSDEVRRWIGKG